MTWNILGLKILLGVFIGLSILLAVKFFLFSQNIFGRLDKTQVTTKDLKIPLEDGLNLNAQLFLPTYCLNEDGILSQKLPLIFINHGWNQSLDATQLTHFALEICQAGPYACLIYEVRGHGNSPGNKELTPMLFDDVPKVLDFGKNLKEIDPDRLGFAGLSFGGEIALTRAYEDLDLKAIIGVCALNNFKRTFLREPQSFKEKVLLKILKIMGVKAEKITEEENKYISPEYILDPQDEKKNTRVMLIHAKDDLIIPFSELEKNQEILNLPKEQLVILEKGGHTFSGQETLLLARVIQFLKKKL